MATYPSRPALSAIVQQAGLNRSGLVADCLFPQVKTDCKFSYVDWTDELLALKPADDSLTCTSDIHEVDTVPFTLVDKSVKLHGLSQVLEECCVSICGDNGVQAKIEAGKTRQLLNKLLIAREQRAINLATADANYVSAGATLPAAEAGGVDGKRFTLTTANFTNPAYALRSYFQGIQTNNIYGQKNVMVTDLATLNGILGHPSFIGAGCVVDPITTPEKAAAILGVEKICIADASYNDGIGATPTMTKLWPAGVILFVRSYEFVTSQDPTFSFGITAYDQGLKQFTWLDVEKGGGAGALMQKQSHDFTEVVLSYKAATKVTIIP